MANTIRVEGLRELKRDVRALGLDAQARGSHSGISHALKKGADEVAKASRPLAPRRTGKLAQSYRAGAAGTTSYVRSRLPYAAVQEYGGVIRPKGTPITIRPRGAVTRALASKEEVVVDLVANALDALAVKHGWR